MNIICCECGNSHKFTAKKFPRRKQIFEKETDGKIVVRTIGYLCVKCSKKDIIKKQGQEISNER